MEEFEGQEERWLALPLGEVLSWLEEKTEESWNKSIKPKGQGGEGAEAESRKLESLRGSLGRVLAWLATQQPPPDSGGILQGAADGMVGKATRARGRVCVKCRRQIRKTSELVTLCPVQLPGLPVHEECFRDLESEFGGKQ